MIILLQLPSNKFDSALGDASYGVFLGHGIVFFSLAHFFGVTEYTTSFRFFATILACLMGWLAFYFVEKPTVLFRRRLKEGVSLKECLMT